MAVVDNYVPALLPWLTLDLEAYAQSIASQYDEVEDYIDIDDGESPWSTLLDPDLCPPKALPYLAMYVGGRLSPAYNHLDPDQVTDARAYIKSAPGQRRGTIRAIVAAAQRTLTGQRTVLTKERAAGSTEDHVEVVTLVSETPSTAQVIADIRTVFPADMVLTYSTQTSPSWTAVQTGKATWAAMLTAYPTWSDVASSTAGYTVWTSEDL